MLKTLKTFLEVRRPKSADERKFMDKHIVVKHADRNGNGDDLFNAKNIKTIKREKEGHGYDTGKDAKVYESFERNCLGKFRYTHTNLRKKVTKVDKNLPKDPDTGTPDFFITASRRKRGLTENIKKSVLGYFDEMNIEVTEAELGELVEDLHEELLGELSGSTLKSYIKKAGRSATYHDDSAENLMGYAKKWKGEKNKNLALDGAAKSATKSVKRVNGIIRAAKKIKEETELDELFSLTIEDLSDKNQALLSSLYESLDLENQINLVETLQEDGGLDEVLDFALSESCITGTKKVSSHEGKNGHKVEVRYNHEYEEYSVHHYKNGKHLGEGPISYHSDKQEAKDQADHDVKHSLLGNDD